MYLKRESDENIFLAFLEENLKYLHVFLELSQMMFWQLSIIIDVLRKTAFLISFLGFHFYIQSI